MGELFDRDKSNRARSPDNTFFIPRFGVFYNAVGSDKAARLIWDMMICIQRISVSLKAYLMLYSNINYTIRYILNQEKSAEIRDRTQYLPATTP